jgi:hypothetical protein
MPMDELDMPHHANYERIIDIYGDDDSEKICEMLPEKCREELLRYVLRTRAGMAILDSRFITGVSGRYPDGNAWILINIWRGARPDH